MGDNGNRAYEDMERAVRGIRRKAALFTLVALGFNAALYAALLWWLKDTKRANEVFTNTFQYQVVGWCAIFMYPYFLRMEVKTDLGLQQGRDTEWLLEASAQLIARDLVGFRPEHRDDDHRWPG